MENKIKELIDAGYTVEDMLKAIRDYQRSNAHEIIRCGSCNKRLEDIDKGEVIIKCRCGQLNKIS